MRADEKMNKFLVKRCTTYKESHADYLVINRESENLNGFREAMKERMRRRETETPETCKQTANTTKFAQKTLLASTRKSRISHAMRNAPHKKSVASFDATALKDEVVHEDKLTACKANKWTARRCQLTRRQFICFDFERSANSAKKPLMVIPLKSIREVRRALVESKKERRLSNVRQKNLQHCMEIVLKGDSACGSIRSVEKVQCGNEANRGLVCREASIFESGLKSIQRRDSNDPSEINELELIISILDSNQIPHKESRQAKKQTHTKGTLQSNEESNHSPSTRTVSYTHLTLPTSDLV
eukprot:TRINITY_DN9590_c0_g1_i2.p1 TRINITY_DN9590_c0_g1~~TRINITY_DN9590_c0_g1_i2.p1  ORF type:complete len:300 (+),score=31.78 TRINITY_DN9590_c0_g1_i2:53-952(+)